MSAFDPDSGTSGITASDRLRREWTERCEEMRPLLRGLRDRDLHHRIERLAFRYLDGRVDVIDRLATGEALPTSLAHHQMAAELHALAHDELERAALTGLTSGRLLQLQTACHRHLELARIRLVLVGGRAPDHGRAVASALAVANGGTLLTRVEPRAAERLLRSGHSVVVAAPFRHALDRRLLRTTALLSSSDIVELEATANADDGDGFDPWPEATPLPVGVPFAATLDQAAAACGWRAA